MEARIRRALARDRTVDITTTGRKSGQPHRIEIWFHNLDGRIYLTGRPGKRDWYANLVAHPGFTFHLKETVQASLPARAIPVREKARRRAVLSQIASGLGQEDELEDWVADSPLVEVVFEE